MFAEFKCGCIVSGNVGRVRICAAHRPEESTGNGAMESMITKGTPKYYPSHGEDVAEWSGK